mgnify:CR=1 FL=1
MQYQIQNPEGFARMLKKLLRQIDYLNWYFERRYQKNVIIVAKCIVLSAVCDH